MRAALAVLALAACARPTDAEFEAVCPEVQFDDLPYRISYTLGIVEGRGAILFSAYIPTSKVWGAIGLRNAGGVRMQNLDIFGMDSRFYSVQDCEVMTGDMRAPDASDVTLTRIRSAERVGAFHIFHAYRYLENGKDFAIRDGLRVDIARSTGTGVFLFNGHAADVTGRGYEEHTFSYCSALRSRLAGGNGGTTSAPPSDGSHNGGTPHNGIPLTNAPGTTAPAGSCSGIAQCAYYRASDCGCSRCAYGYMLDGQRCVIDPNEATPPASSDDDDNLPWWIFILAGVMLLCMIAVCVVLGTRSNNAKDPSADAPGHLDVPLVADDDMRSRRGSSVPPAPVPAMYMNGADLGPPPPPSVQEKHSAPVPQSYTREPSRASMGGGGGGGYFGPPPPLSMNEQRGGGFPTHTPPTNEPPYPTHTPPSQPRQRILPPHLQAPGSPAFSVGGSAVPLAYSKDEPDLHELYDDIVKATSSPAVSPSGPGIRSARPLVSGFHPGTMHVHSNMQHSHM